MVDRFTPFRPALKSITEMYMFCPNCGWIGTVAETEPDIDNDGALGCPNCFIVTEPDEEHKLYIKYTNNQKRAFDLWQKKKIAAEKEYRRAIQKCLDEYETKVKELNQ